VRKFVSGQIQTPHSRTREAIATLYLQRQQTGRVAETRVATPSPTPLKLILPQGMERATAEIRALFDPLRGKPDAPATAAAIESWLLRRVREEYAAETPYPLLRQRRARQKKDPT
jgi:hypothetical protein